MAKDGEVALLLQPYNEIEMLIVWGRQLDQVANAVIKASITSPLRRPDSGKVCGRCALPDSPARRDARVASP